MRILVFSWRDPKHLLAGGAEQVMHEHMKGWVKAGHSVSLFSSKVGKAKKEETIDGVKIVRKGYQYLGVQIEGLFYYLKERKNFDFVVDQFHGVPFFTPLYVKKPKVAVIQETARAVWFLNPLPWPLSHVVGALGFMVEPFIFLLYKRTAFITGSQSAKKSVAAFGVPKKNITVVPHGVLVKKLVPIPAKEKIPTIVYLGVLSKDKGIEDAIKTFHLLKKRKFQYWVIGKAETRGYEKKVKDLVKKLGMDKKVKFWGYVDGAKKFELLAKSQVLLNPSAHEGWGLVNIEANSMGIPVVAYKNPGLVDSVKDGYSGVLTKKNTPESLAREIFGLLQDKKRYASLCARARIWSKNFSWEKSRKLGLEIIEGIYGRKR